MWPRLIESLNRWSSAREVSWGRIEVTLASQGEAPARVVGIVMTPEEWEDLASVAWGDFGSAARQVRSDVLGLRHHERFLVYHQYELVASATAELPVDPDDARMAELARQHPEGFGRWAALDREGNVVDEFRPPEE
jgi:hypothetical protein